MIGRERASKEASKVGVIRIVVCAVVGFVFCEASYLALAAGSLFCHGRPFSYSNSGVYVILAMIIVSQAYVVSFVTIGWSDVW